MKLKEYLILSKKSPINFAQECGLGRTTIIRILQGHDIYLSTALFIEEYTRGLVTCKDLQPTKPQKQYKRKSAHSSADNRSLS